MIYVDKLPSYDVILTYVQRKYNRGLNIYDNKLSSNAEISSGKQGKYDLKTHLELHVANWIVSISSHAWVASRELHGCLPHHPRNLLFLAPF